LLFVPDIFNYFFTGAGHEFSFATTTQLLISDRRMGKADLRTTRVPIDIMQKVVRHAPSSAW